MKITFIIDPPHKLDHDDSSTQLILESLKRGHQTLVINRNDIFWKEGKLLAHTSKLTNVVEEASQLIELKDSDAIFMRQDPPFDMDYIYLTYLLDSIKDEVLIINNPTGIRNANEKIFITEFREFIPETIISKSVEEIKNFAKQFEEGVVIKPLDDNGGSGIFHIHQSDKNKNEIIKMSTNSGSKFIMAQRFLPEIKAGDKRITLLNGEALNYIMRVPHAEDFRGNLHSGARAEMTELTSRDKEIVEAIGPKLREMGLYLVGIDIIGGYITEINTTSPILVYQWFPDTLAKIIEFVEDHLA